MKFEFDNAIVTVHFSRPKEETMENVKKATEKFLKDVLKERSCKWKIF